MSCEHPKSALLFVGPRTTPAAMICPPQSYIWCSRCGSLALADDDDVAGAAWRPPSVDPANHWSDLRALVRRTCHTPLLVAGQFVRVDESQHELDLRREIATPHELLLALEFEILMLKTANVYLQTQIKRDP